MKKMKFKKQIKFGLNILSHPKIMANIRKLKTLDGKFINAWEIFWFMTKALYLYPGIYEYQVDVEIKGMTELMYLILTVPKRAEAFRKKGIKLIGKWAINPTDIYYGAGAVAIDPFYTAFCYMLSVDSNLMAIEGRAELSPDSCPAQAAAYAVLKNRLISMDLFYPFIGPWCYDSQYCFEALRDCFKGFFGDQPAIASQRQRDITKEHMLNEIKLFFQRIERETGVKYSPERLREEIKLENKLRRLCRKIQFMTLDEVIPLGSLDMILVTFLACDWLCDPVATLDMLERMAEYLRERQRNGIRGRGISENPVRLLITGIAWGDLGLYNMIDELGGIIVGSECVMSIYWEDIDQDSSRDPLEIMAERFINVPYTLSAKEKANWTVSNIRKMKHVDGVIVNSNFGCNYNAANNRIVSDIVKKETQLPVLLIDTDLPKESREQFRTRFGAFIEMIKTSRS